MANKNPKKDIIIQRWPRIRVYARARVQTMNCDGKSDFDLGFAAGMRAAVALGRAGATPDDVASVVPHDPAVEDRTPYIELLAELAQRLDDSELFGSGRQAP